MEKVNPTSTDVVYEKRVGSNVKPGCIYIVPTPIGNLGDITLRALDVLRAADCVYAEDTRVTSKLMSAYGIERPLARLDENTIEERASAVAGRALVGETLAFCTDAGMPGVSDPASRLIARAREAGAAVEVLPGASAASCAYVQSAVNNPAYYFGGFLSRKDGARREALMALKSLDAVLVFYESPHRVASCMSVVAEVFPDRLVTLCRELTKLHEEVLTLPASDMATNLSERTSIKGEIAFAIHPPSPSVKKGIKAGEGVSVKSACLQSDAEGLARILIENGVRSKDAAKILASVLGVPKRDAYDMVTSL
jgi:16S rRNA (cytidine1402-2'-O)-methyltransferase